MSERGKMFWRRWAVVNAPRIARILRDTATMFDELTAGPPVWAGVLFLREGGVEMGDIKVRDDDPPFGARVVFRDAKGVETSPADVPVWTSDKPGVASVEASEDGLTAIITPGTPEGPAGTAAVISNVAHDDDGEEVLSGGTVTVEPGDAVIGSIEFSAPA